MRDLLVELARGLRAHVQPFLGSHADREHVQAGAGGDVTFAIDEEAEAWVEQFLAEQRPGRRLLLGGPRAGGAGTGDPPRPCS